MPSNKECETHRAKMTAQIRKETNTMLDKIQKYMENAVEKIYNKIDSITNEVKDLKTEVAENNLNTANVLEDQAQCKRDVKEFSKFKYMFSGAMLIISLIVLPSTIYIVKDYLNSKHEVMTVEKVEEIVTKVIESNYEVLWQDD